MSEHRQPEVTTDPSTGAAPGAAPASTGGVSLGVLVFVVGFSTLGAEIAAARLLAPWFGDSTIVWANTIAIVLLALSLGYSLGGRLADRNPSQHRLGVIILVATVLLAIVPFVSGPFLRASSSAFEDLSVGTFLGSLLGVGVLVAIPLVLLGTVSPYVVRLAVRDVADTGKTAGRLYAISTIGSLFGTFAASLLLIPFTGTRNTFLIFATALGVVAVLALERRQLPAALVPLACACLIALPHGVLKAGSGSDRVIWERETEYQYARVVQTTDGTRTLELNEGQAVHSLYRPGSYLTGGYWDDQLGMLWAGSGAENPKSVAILGSAAGTTARALGHFSPDTRIDAVEIDPEVTEAGKEYFKYAGPNLHTHTADARPWLQKNTRKQDAIIIDAYRQPYIPFYLTTREFFDLVRDRLAPGGVVIVNVGEPEGATKLQKALAATMRSVFGQDQVLRNVSQPTNTMLLAMTDGTEPVSALRDAADGFVGAPVSEGADLAAVQNETADRLEPALTGGPVYTDDRAPVEWLVDLSLADVATGD